MSALGDRLGCLLVQLPPSLPYRPEELDRFLEALFERHRGPVALEPRHPSWFGGTASVQLAARRGAWRVSVRIRAWGPAASAPRAIGA